MSRASSSAKSNQSATSRDWTPKRWLRILLPAVLIVVWLGLAGVGGPTFGKLSSVSSNDQATFLPASAQSTEVANLQKEFYESTSVPAVVVAQTSGEVTPADLREFAQLATELQSVEGVAEPVAPATTSVIGPIPSEDGHAVELIVPISAKSEALRDTIKDVRETVTENLPAGFEAWTTGPAGLLADFVNGFAGIDSLLLLVALIAVFVILLIVYRSLLLPIIVLLTAVFALCASILGIFYLAQAGIITLSGQSQGILSILVIGAATDYALLFVARYREALFEVQSTWVAMWRAAKVSFEPILASAVTVILALLCLLFSDLNSNKSLGPIAAFGIAFSFLAAMTFLPAMLVTFGRAAFWPLIPRDGAKPVDAQATTSSADAHATGASVPGSAADAIARGLVGVRGLWRRVGRLIARRPRLTWIISAIVLLAAVAGLPGLKADGVPQTDLLLAKSQAVDGQKILADHFDAGSGSPVTIIASEADYQSVADEAETIPGVAAVAVYTGAGAPSMPGLPAMPTEPKVVDGRVLMTATLEYQSDSPEAEAVVVQMRDELTAEDPNVIVGGPSAIALDTKTTAQSDLWRVIPIVLGVILLVLILLLRSIIAPVLLVATVVLSYAATLGVSALVFNNVFNFPGADPTVPLFGFVFLVALGIDYNIFLMTRVREESLEIGTRAGILRGLAVTGGVITSAGVVLAATFAALGVIPILFLVQIAFIVAFGVILDTVIVRSLLVPALSFDIGRAIWWPSKLGRAGK